MSNPSPWGRRTPRWSVAGAPAAAPASIAGLPASSACVCVLPPLAASGPRRGLTLLRLSPHELPLSMLLVADATGSAQPPPATIVLRRIAVGASRAPPAAPFPDAVLPDSVTLVSVPLSAVR